MTPLFKKFTSKSVGTGPSSYEKRIYLAAVSQKLKKHCSRQVLGQGADDRKPSHMHCLSRTLPVRPPALHVPHRGSKARQYVELQLKASAVEIIEFGAYSLQVLVLVWK